MAFAGDLITELAKYKELRVIGRLSAFALNGHFRDATLRRSAVKELD